MSLAIAGNLLISVAFNITKHAHNLNAARAVPLPYVRVPLWWCGFATTLVGELGNFAAYGFAEASVIVPLGATTVLANAFIAALVLGEGLRCRDLVGCALCGLGGTVVVLSTPAQREAPGVDDFIRNLQAPAFVVYAVLLSATIALMLGFQDQYGYRHVSYYVLLCSLLGSVTVISCKGVSTFINLWICCGEKAPFSSPVLYLLLVLLAATAILQIRYLNTAMEHFGNTETVPTFYVLFTLCTIVGSNVLYKDFDHEDRWSVAFFFAGCLLTFGGVKLLTSKRKRKASATADGKEAALLPNEHGGGEHGRGSKHHEPGDPPLDDLFQPPPQQGDSDGGSSLDERDMPALSLLNTPMGMSGDVLRRTFSGVRVDSPSSRRGHSRSGSHGGGGAWVAEDVESRDSPLGRRMAPQRGTI